MRVSREKSAETRERILDVAATLFREKGFDGIGLADIMKAAGLTHGGFYNHFGSKDDLEAQATGVALATKAADWGRLMEHAAARPLSALIDEYLSPVTGTTQAKAAHLRPSAQTLHVRVSAFVLLSPRAWSRSCICCRMPFPDGPRPCVAGRRSRPWPS